MAKVVKAWAVVDKRGKVGGRWLPIGNHEEVCVFAVFSLRKLAKAAIKNANNGEDYSIARVELKVIQ